MRPLALLLSLVSLSACNPYHLQAPISLKTDCLYVGNNREPMSFTTVELHFGAASAAAPIALELNLNANDTILNDEEAMSTGVRCDAEDACTKDTSTLLAGMNYGREYKYFRGTAYLRLTADTVDPTLAAPAAVNLQQAPQSARIRDNWHSLGLSPFGSFASYVRQLYEEDFSMLIKYISFMDSSISSYYVTEVTVQPVYKQRDVLGVIDFAANSANWTTDMAFSMLGRASPADAKRTCVTNYGNEVVFMSEPDEYCRQVKFLICGHKPEQPCTAKIAMMHRAPVLSFLLNGVEYKVAHENYLLRNDAGVYRCRFGDISELLQNTACDSKALLAISKGFFGVYMPVLTYKRDGSARMTLLPNDSNSVNAGVSWAKLFVGALSLLAVAAGVYVYFYFERKALLVREAAQYEHL